MHLIKCGQAGTTLTTINKSDLSASVKVSVTDGNVRRASLSRNTGQVIMIMICSVTKAHPSLSIFNSVLLLVSKVC